MHAVGGDGFVVVEWGKRGKVRHGAADAMCRVPANQNLRLHPTP